MSAEAHTVLTEREAAEYLRISISKLRRLRRAHRGPVYVKLDRNVRYRRADLDVFLEKHCSRAA